MNTVSTLIDNKCIVKEALRKQTKIVYTTRNIQLLFKPSEVKPT